MIMRTMYIDMTFHMLVCSIGKAIRGGGGVVFVHVKEIYFIGIRFIQKMYRYSYSQVLVVVSKL